MRRGLFMLAGRLICLLLFLEFCVLIGYCMQEAPHRAAHAEVGVQLPILMYHSIIKDPALHGDYALSPDVFRQDMQYLVNAGYESVLPSDLVAYTQGAGSLPEKPVMITFDDGFYNNAFYALPILMETNMRALVSVIGAPTAFFSQTDDKHPAYAYLSWSDICALHETGYFEIGNHSYALHTLDEGRKGVARKPGESQAAHQAAITKDILRLQAALEAHCALRPIAFAYPYGMLDAQTADILTDMGFYVILTSHERINTITTDPKSLTQLGRFNRPAGMSTSAFMEKALAR